MIPVDRVQRLWKIIEKTNINIDSVFVPNVPDENFYYITGLEGLFEGCFATINKGRVNVAVTWLDYESAKKQGVKKPELVKSRAERITLIKESSGSGRIGIIANRLSYSLGKKLEAEGLTLVDVSACLEECRMAKDKDEIKKIRTAVKVSKDAFNKINPATRDEKSMALGLENHMRSNGCDIAFPTICAADKNSALPHYSGGAAKINNMALVDFGARFQGYCADIARCVFRKKDQWFTKAENNVMKAYDKCVEMAGDGNTGIDMQKAAQKILGKRFIHSIGHCIGREVHETSLSGFKEVLKEGMVFTIEPGVYDVKHGGVRFENDFIVTKNGVREL